MIRIGLNLNQKQCEINDYLAKTPEIKKIKIFYFKTPTEYVLPGYNVEYIEWSDIIMYKFFYRLLEEIHGDTLIVVDELMRTQNRSDLTYNCAHHYLNQTPHKIIFEYFPIIEQKEDFMILLNFENKDKYKGKGFQYEFLKEEDIKMISRNVELEVIDVETTAKEIELYEKKKENLFANLGNKDPDIIPRNLQLLAGDFKKKAIEPDKIYVARNKRFKLDNVISYDEVVSGEYIVIDMHYRRLNLNDFLKKTQVNKLRYLTTTLPIDKFYISEFNNWSKNLEDIYAKASLY